ncbi:MAG: radical SAM protein [Phycisphaerae bacterium]|jgi:spiro-SPASM protein
MRTVAAVFADFEQTFLGGPSQLLSELGGVPILRRTLERLRQVSGLDARCLLVRPRDQAAAERALRSWELTGAIELLPLDRGVRPRQGLLRSARKWLLDGWRGSPLGTTWFDEYLDLVGVAQVLDHYECHAVLALEGHMPLLDVELCGAMVGQTSDFEGEAKMMFTQAPPGLAGVILHRDLTRELLEQDIPLGLLLTYRPEIPRGDPINQPICTHVADEVAHTAMRLTGDTRRSRELLAAAIAELGEPLDAAGVCRWLRQQSPEAACGPLPVEVELELTTDDPLPETTLRPRGSRVPRRHLQDLEAVSRLAAELAAYDDRCVVLGGHGDPLAHPDFHEVCRRLRDGGVTGLAVVTPLVALSDAHLAALAEAKVDMLQVRLDADSPETYRAVHGADHFGQVTDNVARVERMRQEQHSPQPTVACSLTRCAATLAEIERFYDRWIRATGWAVIEGYNEYCGELPADTLLPTEPPVRGPCRRLGRRLMLLADGSAVVCGQDLRGESRVGNWFSEPLSEIWAGANLGAIRRHHSELDLRDLPLCGRCREWYRP